MNQPAERVVVINDFSIARGGATTLVLLLLRLLRTRDIPVTMIVGDDGDNPLFSELGADVVRLGQKELLKGNPLKTVLNGIHNGSASALIRDWIEHNDTPRTIYHVHIWSQILSPSIFVPLHRVAERTLIHAHDSFHACPNGAYMNYPRETQCQLVPLGRDCLTTHCDRRSYAHKLWRVTRQARLFSAMGSDIPWGKFLLIHEKMAAGFLRAGYREEDLLAIRNPASPFVDHRVPVEDNSSYFFIGRLEQEKGPQDALAAARLAGVRLEVVGDGPLKEALVAQYPEMIFHGWRRAEEIGELITTARALVIPSRLPEPFGLVAVEAAASGIPLILTEMAFLAEEVIKDGTGITCNTQDVAHFAAALHSMDTMAREDIRQMSERAYARAIAMANTPDGWADKLTGIYADLLAGEM
ncbi:glycosyltransferase [Rhizobium sp. AG855]|uniref:glycosyltransferase n=1 Tax=Rhizobium sp. AG855 TaxID=2183898 RepID=UPI000FEDF45C|nr:glycosyltransferase [Rhizobium sp. AG855]RKE77542.1 glycosyltransferase involved in cell wall biosynthesis [Rhizobium sp. AG855]